MKKRFFITLFLAFAVMLNFASAYAYKEPKAASFTMTFYPEPNNPAPTACDGDMGTNFNASFPVAYSVADCVDCSTNGMLTAETSVGNATGQNLYSVIRSVLNFDTSAIGSTAVITSATFSIKSTNIHFDFTGGDYIRLVKNSIASNVAYATGDFNSFGTVPQASDVYVSSLASNQYISFTLNSAGKASINKSGVTHFGLRTGLDIANAQPIIGTDENFPDKGGTVVFFYASETSGTSSDPKLTVTFTR